VTSIDIRGGQATAAGHTVKLGNTGKVLFPDDGITKGELIEYYRQVAGRMLPYLGDHPIAMARYPDGITRQRIFQKNPAAYYPGWVLAGELNLTCYVKTTGGKGLHVHLPLNHRQDFEEARGFARDAANVLAARHPDVVTTEQRKDARGGRVYADIMRDSYAQTVVAPCSVRGRPGAHVATLLLWEEAEDPGLSPGRFTLRTIGERLAEVADPWAGLSRRCYDVATARHRLAALAGK